jgi:hypothetical protein
MVVTTTLKIAILLVNTVMSKQGQRLLLIKDMMMMMTIHSDNIAQRSEDVNNRR